MAEAWRDVEVSHSIIPTRDHQGFTGAKLKAGTPVVITDIHRSVFGSPRALSVRDPKTGKYFRNVPMEVFARSDSKGASARPGTGAAPNAAKWRQVMLSGEIGIPVRNQITQLVRIAGISLIDFDGLDSATGDSDLTRYESLSSSDLLIILMGATPINETSPSLTEILEMAWSTSVMVLILTISNAVVPTAFKPWPSINVNDVGYLPLELIDIINRESDLRPRPRRVDLMRGQLTSRVAAIRSMTHNPEFFEQEGASIRNDREAQE